MLKKIQKYLLLNYPLLWNTKIVPFSILLIIINLIFFLIGFDRGKINFYETNKNYSYDSAEPIITFIGGLISVLIIIIWLVFYFKNNAFKSFYPKKNYDLFKEWLIIFVIGFLTTMFSVCYLFAKEVRVRSYFSEKEAKQRCEILSQGSIFLDGSFAVTYHDSISESGDTTKVENNFAKFREKTYKVNSLINKNIENFEFFDNVDDSLMEVKVRNYLYNQDKPAIQSILKNYLKIAREHNLRANINENEWFDLVYNPQQYEEINIVGKQKFVSDYNNNIDESAAVYNQGYNDFDSLNRYKITRNTFVEEVFKHYVPAANLNHAYNEIATAWVSPDITAGTLLFPIYLALGFSLLVFGFRITSGRNWLIAAIALGLIAIVFGLIAALFSDPNVFLGLVDVLILVLFLYFMAIVHKKQQKETSGIAINALLWLFGTIIPLNYFLVKEFYRVRYSDIYYSENKIIKLSQHDLDIKNFMALLDDYLPFMIVFNIVFIFIFMFFITTKIKKWRGIPEN